MVARADNGFQHTRCCYRDSHEPDQSSLQVPQHRQAARQSDREGEAALEEKL